MCWPTVQTQPWRRWKERNVWSKKDAVQLQSVNKILSQLKSFEFWTGKERLLLCWAWDVETEKAEQVVQKFPCICAQVCVSFEFWGKGSLLQCTRMHAHIPHTHMGNSDAEILQWARLKLSQAFASPSDLEMNGKTNKSHLARFINPINGQKVCIDKKQVFEV